ncbi:uncharacterized protein LOC107763530 isoform X3 [Nicotiana tabacum]|uniref:Uncharacterized protein LOC107763530 isoform X3 n=5 Tax=Nicotiana tabacum TaxID=4097 RepID=A0AC58UUP8_TOBAC
MDHQQKRKQPCITTKTHDKNSKRRELYRDMATTKKNALLLQRRLKKREATTNRLLGSRKSINLAESMSAIQENVIVGGSCSISKIGSTSSTSGKSSAPTTEIVLVDVANTIAFISTNEVKEMSKRRRWANYLTRKYFRRMSWG